MPGREKELRGGAGKKIGGRKKKGNPRGQITEHPGKSIGREKVEKPEQERGPLGKKKNENPGRKKKNPAPARGRGDREPEHEKVTERTAG